MRASQGRQPSSQSTGPDPSTEEHRAESGPSQTPPSRTGPCGLGEGGEDARFLIALAALVRVVRDEEQATAGGRFVAVQVEFADVGMVHGAALRTVETNLLGTIRVIDAFTPHLFARGAGTIITVTSGVAFLPFPLMPTYAATKAAVHAYSEALRAELAGTGVEVAELVPPAVATTPEQSRLNPRAFALGAFATEVMGLLQAESTPHEILVRGVLMHRWAEREGTYADLVAQRSRALATLPGRGRDKQDG